MAGGYPKLTNFLWEVKLEQQARMVYQDLLLFIEATVAAGPTEGGVSRLGIATLVNKHYQEFGYRIGQYSILDPLDNLRASSMYYRDLAREGFCLVPKNHAGQEITSENIEIWVSAEGRILAPLWPLSLQVKAFDPETGETDDSSAWDIVVDPLDSRVRLRRATVGR